jgi:predicted RNA-binding Zn-ribbon protein involved in translation (DUF1610 family)
MLTCPRCGVDSLRRSHARRLEKLFRTLSSYRIYRCSNCKWRGWLPTGESPLPRIVKKSVRALLVFAIVILTAITAWLIAGVLA